MARYPYINRAPIKWFSSSLMVPSLPFLMLQRYPNFCFFWSQWWQWTCRFCHKSWTVVHNGGMTGIVIAIDVDSLIDWEKIRAVMAVRLHWWSDISPISQNQSSQFPLPYLIINAITIERNVCATSFLYRVNRLSVCDWAFDMPDSTFIHEKKCLNYTLYHLANHTEIANFDFPP